MRHLHVSLLLAALFAGACAGDTTSGEREATATTTHTVAPAPANPTAAVSPGVSTRQCAPPYAPPPFTVETVFCADPAGLEAATVVRIVDGDTLRVLLNGREEVVRVFGVDTPERGEACFDEASARLEALAGSEVRLLPDERNRDRFDRLLRYVYAPDGLLLDAVLIAEGYGYAWKDDGALRDPLVALERQASAAGTGCLWASR